MIIGLILLVLGTCFGCQAVIKKKYGQDATNVGDEGGFAPNIQASVVLVAFLNLILQVKADI